MTLDSQTIELLGRNRLVSEIIRAGLEVAFPIRDRGVDLIVYADRSSSSREFSAIPIQMKGASKSSFSLDKKYEKTSQLLIVYVWGIESGNHQTFALTYQEALKLANELKYTKTDSWIKNGRYAIGMPSEELKQKLLKFKMTSEKWRAVFGNEKITDKYQKLLELGEKRRNSTAPPNYYVVGQYHNGAYESEYVSPYTKAAQNADASVAIILQDWASHDSLNGAFDPQVQKLGYTPTSPTNINLINQLEAHFGLLLSETFATNLFPFIKPGLMDAYIPTAYLHDAARDFAMPQISIIRPKLVICLGLQVFNILRSFHGKRGVENLTDGIRQPFSDGHTWYWCQAHTSALGFINREHHGGTGSVARDWAKMAASYKGSFNSLPN